MHTRELFWMSVVVIVFSMLWKYDANAAGYVVVKPSYEHQASSMLAEAGLVITEKVPFFPVVYSSFTGVSQEVYPGEDPVEWFSSIQELSISMGTKFTLSPGVSIQYAYPLSAWRNSVSLKFGFKLW